jgi:hypothetical protein
MLAEMKHRNSQSMTTQAGVWIDHRKAVIVMVTDTGEEIRLIISKTEKQLRRAGDSPLQGPYEAQQVPADDSRERKRTGQLNLYYDAAIAGIRAADSLLLLGPGEAKGELTKRLERHHFSGRIVGSETADKMTQRQIAAKVCQYFHAKGGRHEE